MNHNLTHIYAKNFALLCLLLGLSIQLVADEKARETITAMMRYSLMLGLAGLTGTSLPLISKLDHFTKKWTAFVGILFAFLMTQIIAQKTHYIATIVYSILLMFFQALTFIYRPKDLSYAPWLNLANEIVFSFILLTLLSSVQNDNKVIPALALVVSTLKSMIEAWNVKSFIQKEGVQPKQVLAQKCRLLFLSLPSLLCVLVGFAKLAAHSQSAAQQKSSEIAIGVGYLLNVVDVAVRLYIENALQAEVHGAVAPVRGGFGCGAFFNSLKRKTSALCNGRREETNPLVPQTGA